MYPRETSLSLTDMVLRMKQPRALIFGISGQDGAYLAEFLLKKGYHVTGTSRDSQLHTFPGLRRLGILGQLELESVAPNDFRSVLQCVQKVKPNEIYNLSGQSSPALSFAQPVETFESIMTGTLNILESIRWAQGKIRFYNAGSSEVFGTTSQDGADENTAFRPCSPYGVAKAAAIWQVQNYRENYDLKACTGILFNHESPLRPPRFVTRKIIQGAVKIHRGEASSLMLGNLDIQRDWGYAPDYVEAMWRMLQLETPRDYVVATGRAESLRTFVEKAFDQLHLDYRKHVTQDPGLMRKTDILFSRGRPQKANEQLGWKAVTPLEEVIRKMIEEELRQPVKA
jgi:GDPmannose 4,6-dehydratase